MRQCFIREIDLMAQLDGQGKASLKVEAVR